MSLKCLIVDDELIARKLLTEYVNKIPELELVAACSTALKAMQYINNDSIDILLLDIQMPDLTGLDFIKLLPNKPSIILTTAYSEYAVESYELDVVDYLLKPIEFDRFYKAIIKVLKMEGEKQTPIQSPIEHNHSSDDHIFIKADNKIMKVNCVDIQCITSQGAYAKIYIINKKPLVSLQSMSKLEETLPDFFYRPHRSHIININHMDYLSGNTIKIGDISVVISKNKKEEFLKIIDKHKLL